MENKTEFDLFCKNWQKTNTELHTLEKSEKGTLYRTVTKRLVGNKYINDVMYQIFSIAGKRVYVNQNYLIALAAFNGDVIWQ